MFCINIFLGYSTELALHGHLLSCHSRFIHLIFQRRYCRMEKEWTDAVSATIIRADCYDRLMDNKIFMI